MPKTANARRKPTRRISVRRSRELDRRLTAIYGSKNSVADLQRIEHHASHRIRHIILFFVVFFGMGAVGWLVGPSWYAEYAVKKTPAHFSLALVGPNAMTIGAPQTFQIQWKNDTALRTATIRLTHPPDFSILSSTPRTSDPTGATWNLGKLPSGASGVIEIRGIVSGALGTQSGLQAIASYADEAVERTRESLATLALSYDRSVLDGVLEAPAKVFVGDTVMIRYAIVNRGNESMKNLTAFFHPPDGFLVSSSSTREVAGVSVHVPDLLPHASATVQLVGSFASDSTGNQRFSAETGRKFPDGQFFAAQKADVVVPVAAGDLSVHVVVNGSSKDAVTKPKDRLSVSIGYQNTSRELLKNVSLIVGFESFVDGRSSTGTSLLDWSLFDLGGLSVASSTKSRLQTLTFDKKTIAAFERLAPGAEDVIEFSVPIKSLPKQAKDGWIKLFVDAHVPTAGTAVVARTLHAQPLLVRYVSDAAFFAEARYFSEEGAPLGFGPLPPVAHNTTAYRVFWQIHKTVHGLSSVTASAYLPDGVSWSAQTSASAGIIRFDTKTRMVEWSLDRMDDKTADAEASFEVQLLPDDQDIGRFARLLDETSFQAKDAQTQSLLAEKKPMLTTDLQNDDGARSKGVVRKP